MRLILFLIALQPCLCAFAQTALRGQVVAATTRQPIESAYVTAGILPDSVVVAFARTGAAGEFTLSYGRDAGKSYYLSISHISYRTVVQPLPADAKNPIDIGMESGSLVLNEVQVTARIPVREQGDSTRYKVDAFRNGSEQTLEEVLKKMPNVRVEENGDIFFKNKRIEKVLLDGDNLIGNAYQLATRSINPAVLNEVQAIERYSDNKLLRGVEESNQTVLNLTVKGDRKKLLFGSIDAGGGAQRYNGSGNLFSYTKRIKAFAVLSANNTGIRRLDLSDAQASVLPDDRPSSEQLVRPFTQTAQPFVRNLNLPLENLNNERVGTLNMTYNPVKKLKITANLSLMQDRVQAGRFQSYRLIGDVPLTYQQADTLRQRPALAHLRVQADYDLSAETALLYRGTVGTKTIDLAQTTQFTTARVDTTDTRTVFPQQFTNQLQDSRHVLELTHKLNATNVFVLSAQVTRTQLTERYDARLNPVFAQTLFADSMASNRPFGQVVAQDNQLYVGQARWLYGTKTRKFEQQVGYHHNHFGADLTQQNGPVSIGNSVLTLTRQTLYSRTSGKLIWPLFELWGYTQLNYVSAETDGERETRNPVQANLTGSYKLGRLSRVILAYEHQAAVISNSYLLNRAVVTDFRSAQRGQSGLLFDTRGQLSLSYLFTDIALRRMTFFVTAFTVRSNTLWNFADLRFTPDFSISSLINTPNVQTNGLSSTLEKLVYPLSGNIRLLINVTQSQAQQVVNGQERSTVSLMPSITAKYISVFESPLNMEVVATYRQTNLTATQIDQQFKQRFTAFTAYTTFFYRKKTWQAGLTAELSRIQQNDYFFLKANVNHQFTPRLSARLEAQNLLNQTSYRQLTITPTVVSAGVFPLLPRMTLLYAQYSF